MFFDITDDFPFIKNLEANWKSIKSEVDAQAQAKYEVYEHSKDGGWKIMLFVMLDTINQELADACPKTMELLKQVPNLTFAAASKLSRHSKIHPHKEWIKNEEMHHYNNGNLHRCHLALTVPRGEDKFDCAMRVADEVRTWQPGKCLMFDDTVEHEVWNNTDEDRIVLVIDFIKDGDRLLETEEIRALKKHMIDLHIKKQ